MTGRVAKADDYLIIIICTIFWFFYVYIFLVDGVSFTYLYNRVFKQHVPSSNNNTSINS